ncbi:MAG: RnfABCDGE type electron transport complex subunit D [Elusimicrobia bacterium]|nr:RnfABCDGE type electron transport complex subunit D [Elusimicrobiota bacterium]
MIRKIMDIGFRFTEKNKAASALKPILVALDASIYGTGDVTIGAPHIADGIDIKRFMSVVVIALMPAALAGVYYYGLKAVLIIAVSYLAGGLVEVLFAIIRKREIEEGFLVTGLIFALTLPSTVPLWVVAVGIFFGTFFGKEVFGGTGRNIFNPALVGRLFITISFPSLTSLHFQDPGINAIASATPLILYKSSHIIANYSDLLLGKTAGSIGETFRIGLIFGGIFLILTKISNWRIPFSYLASVLIMSLIGSHFIPEKIAPPLFQLLSGGLLFGALFMATDPVTSPFTKEGKYIFGLLCGLLTVIIRSFSGYVEGVMFSIILMNTFTPLIDSTIIGFKYRNLRR